MSQTQVWLICWLLCQFKIIELKLNLSLIKYKCIANMSKAELMLKISELRPNISKVGSTRPICSPMSSSNIKFSMNVVK